MGAGVPVAATGLQPIFAGFQLATREFPEAAMPLVRGPLANEVTAGALLCQREARLFV